MKYYTPQELRNTKKEEVSQTLSQLAGKNVRYNFALEVFRKYAAQFSWPKSIKILDLGTASGEFLQQLYNEGYQNLFAHDIDDYLPPTRKAIIKEYKFAELSMEKLPWPDDSFDIVTAWCVLPHLENPFFAAREVHRVLNKNGFFIFTTLHLTSKASRDFFNKHKYFGSYRETNNHISLLPMSVIKKTMLKFFDLEGVDYLVIPKIFAGLKGKIRKFIFDLAKKIPKWEIKLKDRWGYNVVYLLRKKSLKE